MRRITNLNYDELIEDAENRLSELQKQLDALQAKIKDTEIEIEELHRKQEYEYDCLNSTPVFL